MTCKGKLHLGSNVLAIIRFPSWLGIIVGVISCCLAFNDSKGQETSSTPKFIICYNPSVPVQEFEAYDLVVVDFSYPSKSVAHLKRRGKTVFGYLSLGKVQKQRPFLLTIQAMGIGCEQDLQYPDSFRIDVTNSSWQALVLDSIVPKMKKVGFDGIFLDDLDDLKVRKLEERSVALIEKIRASNPELQLMANRGLEYSAKFAASIDYLLLESCFLLDGEKRKAADTNWALKWLAEAKEVNSRLKGVAIDYVSLREQSLNKSQIQLIRDVRSSHVKNNLISCVSFKDLQSVPRY